ncbi:glycosyltransferase [Hymenobacter sp. UV11]|uniref:glycosyltransferase family 4 protein n=1 Tax=Hymenobacter sp. UV11 TaxID=1849735 RepID=UPI0010606D1D|nr:glycosyltransferase family 4 protein [Hymenobacter sp. UV11]TDN39583.1 glycosyl transferase family 1 [Hymenobacter sp. UV11]TFZ63327.1 glycosyltransferase [Hymenobacter sp. UV11]
MKIILSHPTGNANVRAVATGLLQAGILTGFHTTVATFPGTFLDRLSSFSALAELSRRRFDPALKRITRLWPWRELARSIALKAGLPNLTAHETGLFSVDAVYQSFDRRVAASLGCTPPEADAVYAYEDGAYASFLRAKQLRIQCLYDLPIGYWRAARRLLEAEKTRWPEWAATLTNFEDSEAKLARKDEELRLADRIFVASQFTAETLNDFPGVLRSVEVIPYGFPAVGEPRQYADLSDGRPLKLLFVGGLSQRKGIADLFAAVATLGSQVELTIVGRKATDNCPALNAALSRHHWIESLPHAEVLRIMREHDVLVFPSLFEGFGLVITEAMSQGTPVITTNRTAGPDVIQHGHNGWLIEAGTTAALQTAIEHLLHRPSVIAEAGRAAMETARQRPWSRYGQELAAALAK